MNDIKMTRRSALGLTGALLAGCSASRAESDTAREMIVGRVWRPRHRIPPGNELVNSLEFEDQARLTLAPDIFEAIAGSDREPFNRMTFRPRTNIPTLDMDLTVTLWGEELFTPILVGPISDQAVYSSEGELATVRGAASADTLTIVSGYSSVPIQEIIERTGEAVWYSVYADDQARQQAQGAVAAGARVLVVSVGASYQGPARPPRVWKESIDWGLIDFIRQGLDVPVVLKGITTAEDASAAVELGIDGLVVSTHGWDKATIPAMDALSSVVETVDGRVPVLADGSFRRGSDVLKALILGADAVLVGRPAVWALSVYGAEGVQWMLEKLQEELARDFAMVGASTPGDLRRRQVRIHTKATE